MTSAPSAVPPVPPDPAPVALPPKPEKLTLGTDSRGAPLSLKLPTLLRHVAILGSSGSGKTVTCKVLCEELALAGIPIIAIDPQGDIASLAMPGDPDKVAAKGVPDAARRIQQWREHVEVAVWTPASSAGLPLCLNPLQFDRAEKSEHDRVREFSFVAKQVTQLLGYDTSKGDGTFVEAFLDLLFTWCHKHHTPLRDFSDLAGLLKNLPEELREKAADVIPPREVENLLRQVTTLTIGARKLLFTHGTPLDIDALLKPVREVTLAPTPPGDGEGGPGGANTEGQSGAQSSPPKTKTRVSVIYLNTLNSQEEKAFFVGELAQRLYNWMLDHPSKTPQALLYIDEIAPFLPPVRKPACKDALQLLFKQARKYGVCCLVATQSPGDVDYKSLGQVATVMLGRLGTVQDINKMKHLIKSLAPQNTDEILDTLPSLEKAQFLVMSPDEFDKPQRMKTRWLLTDHVTLEEDNLAEVVPDELRDAVEERGKHLRREQTRLLAKPEKSDNPVGAAPSPAKPTPLVAGSASKVPVQSADSRSMSMTLPDPTGEIVADLVEGVPLTEVAGQTGEELETAELVEKPEPETSEDVGEIEKRCQVVLNHLSQSASALTQQEIGKVLKLSKGQVARSLKELESRGAIHRVRVGVQHRFYSAEYDFHPKLGIVAALDFAPLAVREPAARLAARKTIPSGFLGLVGPQGEIAEARLRYLPLWRVNFVGKETVGMLWWKELRDKHESIYFHPTEDKILLLTTQGFKFTNDVDENPVLIRDLDNLTRFEHGVTKQAEFCEEFLAKLHTPKKVSQLFQRKFKNKPDTVSLVFIPVWEFTIQAHGAGKRTVVRIDGVSGNVLMV